MVTALIILKPWSWSFLRATLLTGGILNFLIQRLHAVKICRGRWTGVLYRSRHPSHNTISSSIPDIYVYRSMYNCTCMSMMVDLCYMSHCNATKYVNLNMPNMLPNICGFKKLNNDYHSINNWTIFIYNVLFVTK